VGRAHLLAVALVATGCGSSPVAPTPPLPTASLAMSGNLSVTGCLAGTGSLYTCAGYSGAANNSGAGCAVNVKGVVTSFDATTRAQVGTSGWTYGSLVRPGETIAYSGLSLIVTGPLTGGWYYTTTLAWDTAKCP
jgi:hypothetical protein